MVKLEDGYELGDGMKLTCGAGKLREFGDTIRDACNVNGRVGELSTKRIGRLLTELKDVRAGGLQLTATFDDQANSNRFALALR